MNSFARKCYTDDRFASLQVYLLNCSSFILNIITYMYSVKWEQWEKNELKLLLELGQMKMLIGIFICANQPI